METPSGDERAFSRLQEGLLVLADISGYTAFVAQIEVDRSWEILGLDLRPEIAALSKSGSSVLVAVKALLLRRLPLPDAQGER